MSAHSQAEEVRALIPEYERMFTARAGITPNDHLKFHLRHLAEYWSPLVQFCRVDPSRPEVWMDGNLGACVHVASDFANKLILADSPIYGRWQEYWAQAQMILHERPVRLEDVETAYRMFSACLAELKYEPWASTSE